MTEPIRPEPRVLLLPGWLDSGPGHWQSRWEQLHGFERVQQADWVWPRRGDWMARLDEVVQAEAGPAVLVAHSLGCHLVAAWAAHSRFTGQVQAALLVAVPDVEREDMPPNLFNWRPVLREPLPFASRLLYSLDDPYASPVYSRQIAAAWRSPAQALGELGHVNGDSGLGDWPEGLAVLQGLLDAA
jgi:predicted alpha/beta hydrolase family esterase